jgi:hypothetical protein
MPYNKTSDEIRALKDQLAKAQQRLKELCQRQKEETERRHNIEGGIIERYALENPGSDFTKTVAAQLETHVPSRERWLFAEVFEILLPSALNGEAKLGEAAAHRS